jgi:hypothetical protein
VASKPDSPTSATSAEQDALDVDSAFAAIVAAWGTETPSTWPAQEDLSLGRHRRPEESPGPLEGRRASDRSPERRSGDQRFEDGPEPDLTISGFPGPLAPLRRDPEEILDRSDDFVPPDPPLPPRGDAFTMLAWAGVVLGPIFLLFAVVFWRDEAPQTLMLASVLAFIGGFVVLVARMPRTRDDDDDDGAVV